MRALLTALLLLGALAAGCFGGGGGGKGAVDDPPASTTATGTGVLGQLQASFTYTPANPRVDEPVRFTGKVANLGALTVRSWSWTWGDGTEKGSGSSATHTFTAAGAVDVRLDATLSDGRNVAQTRELFVLNVGEEVPGNGTDPSLVPGTGSFVCDGVPIEEPNETFGTDDTLPGLTWATLKTGSRLAVLWTSEAQVAGSLTYWFGNGTPSTVTESVPNRVHLLVVDGLSEGRTLCFTASMGGVTTPVHAVRTVNAMTSFRPGTPHGVYTMNFLAVSNEGGDSGEVAAGIERYADMLWDATDGWVRAGAVLLVEGDLLNGNAGWAACYLVTTPYACRNVYDVVVSNDAAPQGAASTYRQGIRDPDAAIWMNQYHQAMPGPVSLDDFGPVLTHEVGHYAFDMADLYGDNTVVTTECYDSATGISIMAGDRRATEFDDPAAPCPNQPAGYTTSWELAQGEFGQLPDRPDGPLPGPEGNGGVFLARTFRGL